MKFPFFATFIVFLGWLFFRLRKNRQIEENQRKSFWDLENEANNTRRKPLDDLAYITIPFDNLPMTVMTDDSKVAEYHEIFYSLAESSIVNFSNISNTELKLRYGAPNINLLSRYDQNYLVLVRTLQQWAYKLYEGGFHKEACTILEFAVSIGTDISHSYFLLAKIYNDAGTSEKIKELISAAEQINSPMRGFIVRTLQES